MPHTGLIDVMHEWANFFMSLAQISGVLVGLVFVALTFKPKAFGRDGDPLLRALARQVFADFLLLLLVSMLMLAPTLSAQHAGGAVLVLIGVGMARIVRELIHLRHLLGRWSLAQRLVLSLVGNLLVGIWGLALLRPPASAGHADHFLLIGAVVLLLSGCRSAWLLVVNENA